MAQYKNPEALTEILARQWAFVTQEDLSPREAVAFLLSGMQLRSMLHADLRFAIQSLDGGDELFDGGLGVAENPEAACWKSYSTATAAQQSIPMMAMTAYHIEVLGNTVFSGAFFLPATISPKLFKCICKIRRELASCETVKDPARKCKGYVNCRGSHFFNIPILLNYVGRDAIYKRI